MKFTETKIAAYLARVIFERKHLMMVPNCSWPGSECDLLVVTPNLRVIDVEIKISRADLKADAKKEKWFEYEKYIPGEWQRKKHRVAYPSKVWKHYYCLPEAIWKQELYGFINAASGVLLIYHRKTEIMVRVERRAKPNINATHLTAPDAIDIARLASLRMWDAYDVARKARSEANAIRQRAGLFA